MCPHAVRRLESLWLALALLFGLGLASALRSGPPAPRPIEATTARDFSAQRAQARLETWLAEGVAHPTGSRASERVRKRLLAAFERAGYAPLVRRGFGCGARGVCADVRNVLARLPGREGGPALLLVAHYDSVPAGPGASDDTLGAAVLLEVAHVLGRGPPLRHDVLFLIDEGEEQGLLGAEAFVDSDPWAAEVAVVLNVEARGTSGASLMFQTSAGNAALVGQFAAAVDSPRSSSLFSSIYERLPNDTDLSVFKRHGHAGLNFAHIGHAEHYHTPRDDLAHVNTATLQHHGDQLLALARALGEAELPLATRPDAVFFDLLGWRLVHWPEAASLPAALLVLIGTGVLAWRELRGAGSGRLALGEALLVFLFAPLCAAALALGATRGLSWLAGVPAPWTASPWPTRIVCWSLGLAVVTGFGLRSPRGTERARATRLALLGTAAAAALIALVLAWVLPGAAFLWLLPAAAGSAAAAFARWLAPGRRGAELAALLPLAVCAVLWLPLALAVEQTFGLSGGGLIAACVAMAALPMRPLVQAASWPRRRALFWGPAALALVALPAAALVRPYDAEHPRPLNLMYAQVMQRSGGIAASRFLAQGDAAELPAALRAAADFGADVDLPPPVLLGWHRSRASSGPAPPLATRGPELRVLERAQHPLGRRLRLQLRSPRGAPRIEIWLPPGVEPESVTIDATSLPATSTRQLALQHGWRRFVHANAPAEGFEMELVLPGSQPLEAWLLDRAFELPELARPLLAARPLWAVPVHSGDTHVVARPYTL